METRLIFRDLLGDDEGSNLYGLNGLIHAENDFQEIALANRPYPKPPLVDE